MGNELFTRGGGHVIDPMRHLPTIADQGPGSETGPLRCALDMVREVSSLPHVAMRIIEVVGDPDSSGRDLREAVESDPSLAARVLRTVNSTFYGLRTEVSSVQRAIALLGFLRIRDLAVTASIAEAFRAEAIDCAGYTRAGLWSHLVSVGIAARMIAARGALPQFEEAFLAGLLHDLGIVLIDQHLHKRFATLLGSLTSDRRLDEAERDVFGFDHAEFGAALGEKWGLPPTAVAAMRFHHRADEAEPASRVLVRVVRVADFLCAAKGIRSVASSAVDKPTPATLEALSLDREGLRVLWEDLDPELEQAQTLISL